MILRGKEAERFLREIGELDDKAVPKYRNEKVMLDGIKFDSKREAERYSSLKVLERVGEIEQLELQKKFVLVPAQRGRDGKVSERAITYRADFYYYSNRLGRYVVEDSKGDVCDRLRGRMQGAIRSGRRRREATNPICRRRCGNVNRKKTDVYKMKKKLMRSVHGLEIVEV